MIAAYRLGYYLAISIPQFAPTRARWAAPHLGLVRCYRYCSKHGLKILLPFLTKSQ